MAGAEFGGKRIADIMNDVGLVPGGESLGNFAKFCSEFAASLKPLEPTERVRILRNAVDKYQGQPILLEAEQVQITSNSTGGFSVLVSDNPHHIITGLFRPTTFEIDADGNKVGLPVSTGTFDQFIGVTDHRLRIVDQRMIQDANPEEPSA